MGKVVVPLPAALGAAGIGGFVGRSINSRQVKLAPAIRDSGWQQLVSAVGWP
jgi:hypothetical protein